MSEPKCGGGHDPATCRLCWLAARDAGQPAPDWPKPVAAAPAPKAARCRHLGDFTDELIERPGKPGERLKLYECAVYGRCVLGNGKVLRETMGIGCCGCDCPKRELVSG